MVLHSQQTTVWLLWISLIGITLYGLWNAEIGRNQEDASSFIILTKHYGVNASEIERSITDGLENAVAELPGIKEIKSTSEYSQSRLQIILADSVSSDDFYLLLRDRIDRVYAQWPDSVQRPQVHSSSENDQPIFIASFFSNVESTEKLRDRIDDEVEPRVKRIEGVGEVHLGGGGVSEIHVELIPDRTAGIGLTPGAVGSLLQQHHIREPMGLFDEGNRQTPIILDGHFPNLESTKKLQVNSSTSGSVPLDSVAIVDYKYRETEDISRLDGRKTVTLYVKATGDANIVKTSRLLRREMKFLSDKGYTVETSYDMGADLEESIRGVLVSLFIGMGSVALFLSLCFPSWRVICHLILSLPLIGGLAISILSFVGTTIDQSLLAGMAVGIGLMIDGALVITDGMHQGHYHFHKSAPPLIASTLTTIIVFIPLLSSEASFSNIKPLSIAIMLLLPLSLAYYLGFLPHFLTPPLSVSSRLSSFIVQPPQHLIHYSATHPKSILLTSALITLLGIYAVIQLPKDIGNTVEEDVLFVRLEMESGATIESVDRRTGIVLQSLKERLPSIISIESRAKSGQSLITLRYDESKLNRQTLGKEIQEISSNIPNVFAYIPERSSEDQTAVEFTLTGGDNSELRDLAVSLVNNAETLPWVEGGVLHFKENPPAYIFYPDLAELAKTGVNVQALAGLLKWSIQGPVALKWFQNGKERDLRVFAQREATTDLAKLHNLRIPIESGVQVSLGQLGEWVEGHEPSRISHANRQRAVQFSLITYEKDLNSIIENSTLFIRNAVLPSGYGLFPDAELQERKAEYHRLWISLTVALALIYAVLAIQGESFVKPGLVLAILPVSLAFPVIIYALIGRSLRDSTLIGIIILSGMAVNNAILILENRARNDVIAAVIGRYRSLVLTTGTTVLGTLPLILRAEKGTSFTFDMSLVLVLGLIGSFITSITFYPAFLSLKKSKY